MIKSLSLQENLESGDKDLKKFDRYSLLEAKSQTRKEVMKVIVSIAIKNILSLMVSILLTHEQIYEKIDVSLIVQILLMCVGVNVLIQWILNWSGDSDYTKMKNIFEILDVRSDIKKEIYRRLQAGQVVDD